MRVLTDWDPSSPLEEDVRISYESGFGVGLRLRI
jgi:hypothetical protein